jgi:hypothetical protein
VTPLHFQVNLQRATPTILTILKTTHCNELRSYVWLDEEGTYSARKAQFRMIGQANVGTTPSRTLMKQYDIYTLYMRTG